MFVMEFKILIFMLIGVLL